jgi:zinc protease
MAIAIVTNDAAGLKKTLVAGKPTPPAYDAPKPKDVLDEDKIIERLSLGVEEKDVRIVPIAEMFR